MPDLRDGESVEMQGSGSKPYLLRNVGGVYSCSCPAWRNQSVPIERRTCKHLRKLRGDAAEEARLGGALSAPPRTAAAKADKDVPGLLLADRWDTVTNLQGWWMSEKLDGVRAYWDGKQFLSRQGNVYHAPDWFIRDLPDFPLDGELWLDRRMFQRAVSIARRQDKSEHWKELRYVVFDAPGQDGEFEGRLKFVEEFIAGAAPAYATGLEQTLCKGIDHLREELSRVEALGDAVEGQELPGRRGPGDRPRAGQGPAQGPAGGAAGGAEERQALQRGHRVFGCGAGQPAPGWVRDPLPLPGTVRRGHPPLPQLPRGAPGRARGPNPEKGTQEVIG
jgi:DNA ligase-1